MSIDEMKTVALIGHGYWGPNLLRNYMAIPDAKLKWVCDLRPAVLDEVQRRHPAVQTTTSADDVLRDPEVDGVLIATPIGTHYQLCKAALLAGKHVFVEKPLTSSAEQCVDLTLLAADRNLTLMVGHTFIYSPPVRKIKDIIDAGELGDVHFVTMQRVNLGLHQKDASVIWDLAAHDMSILDYWLGETPSAVASVGRDCMRIGIPDVAFLNLEYRCGVVALINVSWLSPVKLRGTIIVGSRKMLVYDDTAPVEKVKVFDHGAAFKEPESFAEFQMVYRTGDILSPEIANTEPLRLEAEHFLRCLRTGSKPITDGEMGLRVVAALEAADASLREGVKKSVERRHRADRRVRVIAALESAADRSPHEDAARAAGRRERRYGPDRRLRVVADQEAAGLSVGEDIGNTVDRPERRRSQTGALAMRAPEAPLLPAGPSLEPVREPANAGVQVAPGVTIGSGADLQAPCVVGKAPRGAAHGELPLVIGSAPVIRPFTTIYAGSIIGDRLQTGQGASIREDNVVGDDVSIGTNAVLEFGNRVGNRVRIHSGCFLEMVTIEDDVFVGPNVVFTDDPHPMNCPRYKDCKGGAVVHRLARIGANVTVLPGVVIGENSLVGAGAVVVDDVPPGAVVVGNPARVVKYVGDITCNSGLVATPFDWDPYEPTDAAASPRVARGSTG